MAFLGNAFGGNGFDANSVQPSAPMEILPPGKYVVQIVESEMADTRAGNGQMLKLTFEVMYGEHERRKLWANLNLINPNPTAVEIAQRDLSAICHAVGKLQVNDSEELHFKPLMLTVAVQTIDKKTKQTLDKPRNEISGYAPVNGAAPAAQAPRPQAAARPQPAAQPSTMAQRPAAPPMANAPWRRAG